MKSSPAVAAYSARVGKSCKIIHATRLFLQWIAVMLVLISAPGFCQAGLPPMLEVSGGYSYGMPIGSNMYTIESFSTPSAFTHLGAWHGYELKALLRMKNKLSVGGAFGFMNSGTWEYKPMNDYEGMRMQQYVFSLPLQILIPLQKQGFFENVYACIELAPSAGYNKIYLPGMLMWSNTWQILFPRYEHASFFGFRSTAGLVFYTYNIVGVRLGVSYDRQFTEGVWFNDTHFSRLSADIGLVFTLFSPKQ